MKWREFQELQMYGIGARKLRRAILPLWWSLINFCGRPGDPPAATLWGDVRCSHMVGNTWIERNQENQLMSNRMFSRSSLDEWCFTYLYWFFAQHQSFMGSFVKARVTAAADLLQESILWSWLEIMESRSPSVCSWSSRSTCSSW